MNDLRQMNKRIIQTIELGNTPYTSIVRKEGQECITDKQICPAE